MEGREEKTTFSIWVNWERSVISFTPENGFEELQCPAHEEMFQFAAEKEMKDLEFDNMVW